jgi:hypothetical protein
MSEAALSVFVFGVYVILIGLGFTLIPNTMLGLFGVPATSEPWIRVLGWVLVVLGYYCIQTARHELQPFFLWTVYGRASVMLAFLVFFLLAWAPATILLFGAVDLLGAIWTLLALRAQAKHPAPAA